MGIAARNFAFMDEVGFDDRSMYRLRGWAPVGERASAAVPRVRGTRYSLMLAINQTGVVCYMIVAGAANSVHMEEFLTQCFIPNVDPVTGKNTILVLDNAKTHKAARFGVVMRAARGRLQFLPPYSPDYNPIELVFSWMRAWVRRNRCRYNNLLELIEAAVAAVHAEPNLCRHYVRKCGLYQD